MRNKLEKVSFVLGSQILLLVGFTIFIASIFLLLNLKINFVVIIFSFILSIIIGYIILKNNIIDVKERKKYILIVNTFFILVVVSCISLSAKIFDISFDGQMYHQDAVIQLQEGWNPLYDDQLNEEYAPNIWVNHYAKASWYFAAVIYDLMGNIEYGKSINVLLLMSSVLIVFSLIIKIKNSLLLSMVCSILIVLNPVTINQLFTFYVDGLLYSTFLILVTLLIRQFIEEDLWSYCSIILALIILINIKFTALGYALILCLLPLILKLYNLYFDKQIKSLKLLLKGAFLQKLNLILVIGVILGVLVVGSSSYVTNFIDHKHPLYPLAGEGKIDIITGNTPESLRDKNKIEQLYLSVFSESSNSLEGGLINKFPLTVTKAELTTIHGTDVRVGGFGPLFGAIIIFTIIGLLIWKEIFITRLGKIVIAITSVIIITIVINPEMWWARYVPQLWMIPIIFLLILNIEKKNIYVKIYTVLLLLVIGINSMIMAGINYKYNSKINDDLIIQLEAMSEYSKSNEILIDFDIFKSNRARLDHYDIEYSEIEELSCEIPQYIPFSNAVFCVDNLELFQKTQANIYNKYH